MSDQAKAQLAEMCNERINDEEDFIPFSEASREVAEEQDVSERTANNYIREYCEVDKDWKEDRIVVGMKAAFQQAATQNQSGIDASVAKATPDEVETESPEAEWEGDVAELDQEPGEVLTLDEGEMQAAQGRSKDYICPECGSEDVVSYDGNYDVCESCSTLLFEGLQVLEDVGHPMVPDVEQAYFRREQRDNTTDVSNICWSMSEPDFATLLQGETGVGKDFAVKYICYMTNRPMVRVNFGEGILYEDLVGGFSPAEGEDDFAFKPGLLYQAFTHGYVFVADEVNAAGPEATMPLHGVTEDEGSRELDVRETGEVLKPHPEFKFVGTMNPPTYGGTKELNDAFRSRFFVIDIDYLPKDGEKRLLYETTPFDNQRTSDQKAVENITSVAESLRESYRSMDIVTPVSHRDVMQIGKLSARMDPEEATKMVLLNSASAEDKNAIGKAIEMHF